MDEFERIALIKKKIKPSSKVLVGIGDDTAVLRSPRGKMLITVDALVEGVHFDLRYASPEDVGHKALAVNLSDIAAMGGKPLYAVVSLGCGKSHGPAFLDAFYNGLLALAKSHDVAVVGGNLTSSPHFFADVTVVGEVKGAALTRSGMKKGDWIGVVGSLGSAAMGLASLRKRDRAALTPAVKKVQTAQLRPQPLLREGQALQKTKGVSALIDVSDGLASELHHLARASSVGVEIRADYLPIDPAVRRLSSTLSLDPLSAALYGGEDYALLVSGAPRALNSVQRALRRLGQNLVVIGEATRAKQVVMRLGEGAAEPLLPRGWNHWATQ